MKTAVRATTPLKHQVVALLMGLALLTCKEVRGGIRAAATVVDITPTSLPVIVNGGFLSRTASQVKTPLHARALAIADGACTAVIVLVDSCLLDRPFLDDVKRRATELTSISVSNILIAVTHTHTAPAATGALGTDPDPTYPPFLRDRLVEAIAAAPVHLEPVLVGFTRVSAPEFTAPRRWFLRPDRVQRDPFGDLTVRATMHAPLSGLEHVTGETGPEDPSLELLSFRSPNGHPVAVLANFSMHYFGDSDISADYFGLFCEGLCSRLALEPVASRPPFVALFSQGCSGDIWRRDYSRPTAWDPSARIEDYTQGLLDLAETALRGCVYREAAGISMLEYRFPLRRRTPDPERLKWARRIVERMGNRSPTNRTEVYAREQVLLHAHPTAEIVLQVLRIGEVALVAHPCEAYAITGLKIKTASPLPDTMVIELANGAEGYIPPPEQHSFGGYTTWPARTAALDVDAEPRIVEELLRLLEHVAGRPRRPWRWAPGPGAQVIRRLRPLAYWRLNEFCGPHAEDEMGAHHAQYEHHIAFHLDGPERPQFNDGAVPNRAPHFAGGRLRAHLPNFTNAWSLTLWFWNGMPPAVRGVTGWMFSIEHESSLASLHVGVGGTNGFTGRLIARTGRGEDVGGQTELTRWTWYHLALICDGTLLRVYLDGHPELELSAPPVPSIGTSQWLFGSRNDGMDNWEGRLDEIAVFNRPLSLTEILAVASRE